MTALRLVILDAPRGETAEREKLFDIDIGARSPEDVRGVPVENKDGVPSLQIDHFWPNHERLIQ